MTAQPDDQPSPHQWGEDGEGRWWTTIPRQDIQVVGSCRFGHIDLAIGDSLESYLLVNPIGSRPDDPTLVSGPTIAIRANQLPEFVICLLGSAALAFPEHLLRLAHLFPRPASPATAQPDEAPSGPQQPRSGGDSGEAGDESA